MWACLTATIVWYALRPSGAGRRIASVAAIAIVAFVGGYFAHRVPQGPGVAVPSASRFASFDIARAPLESAPALGAIDHVAPQTRRFVDISGWIADGVRARPGAGIFLLVDDVLRTRPAAGYYGGDRPDVARVFNNANLLWVGYGIRYVPANLGPGNHYLQIVIVSDDLKHAYILPQHVAFATP